MVTFQHQHTAAWLGVETTWGTAVSRDTKIGTVMNVDPNLSWEVFENRGAGDGREVQDYIRTRFNCRIGLTVQLHDFNILRHAIGPRSGAGTSGDPYTITEADHTGVTSGTDIIPFTLEVGSNASTDDVDVYEGCYVDEFTLQADLGRALILRSTIIAEDVTSSTSVTSYTPLTTKPLIVTEALFKWGATPSTVSKMRSVSITYRNSLIIYGDFNTPLIVQPECGRRLISWTGTMLMTDTVATTLRDDFYGQANSPITTAGDMKFVETNEIALVFDEGSGTGDRDATVQLDHCIIESISKPIDIGGGDLVLVTFTGRAATSKSDEFVQWYTN